MDEYLSSEADQVQQMILYSNEVSQRVHALQTEKKGLQIFAVQSLGEMVQEHTKHYPYDVEYSEVQWDPVLILHSSGSTGKVNSNQYENSSEIDQTS